MISWTNAELDSIGLLQTKFIEARLKIYTSLNKAVYFIIMIMIIIIIIIILQTDHLFPATTM